MKPKFIAFHPSENVNVLLTFAILTSGDNACFVAIYMYTKHSHRPNRESCVRQLTVPIAKTQAWQISWNVLLEEFLI